MERRSFVGGVAGGAFFVVAGCKPLKQGQSGLKITKLPKGLKKRKNWNDLTGNEKKLFAKGVELMVQDKGPLGWASQADLHHPMDGVSFGITVCRHGDPLFLPWHRGHLTCFENIMISKLKAYLNKENPDGLTLPPDFGLPYWAWEDSPQIPEEFLSEPFLKPQLIENPTMQSRARNVLNAGYSEVSSAIKNYYTSETSNSTFLGTRIWRVFANGGKASYWTSEFERWHGYVHVEIGGSMSRASTTGRDPLFWLHHCNVDRIWSKWMTYVASSGESGTRYPVIPSMVPAEGSETTEVDQEAWLKEAIGPFYDASGKEVTYSVKDTILSYEEPFSFQYEEETVGLEKAIFSPPYGIEAVNLGAVASDDSGNASGSSLQLNKNTGRLQSVYKDGVFLLDLAPIRRLLRRKKVREINLNISGLPLPDSDELAKETIDVVVKQGGRRVGFLMVNSFGLGHDAHHHHQKGHHDANASRYFSQIMRVKAKLTEQAPLSVKLKKANKFKWFNPAEIRLDVIVDVEV